MSDRRRKRRDHRDSSGESRDGGQSRPVPSAARPAWPIKPGWKVYTSDNETLGHVAEASAGGTYFTVRRGLLFRMITLYVPLRVVRGASEREGGYVLLRATKHEALAWRHAPVGRREQLEPAPSSAGEPGRPLRASAADTVAKRTPRKVEVKRRHEVPSIPVRDLYGGKPLSKTGQGAAIETHEQETLPSTEESGLPATAPSSAGPWETTFPTTHGQATREYVTSEREDQSDSRIVQGDRGATAL